MQIIITWDFNNYTNKNINIQILPRQSKPYSTWIKEKNKIDISQTKINLTNFRVYYSLNEWTTINV